MLDCRKNLPAHSKSLQSALTKPTSSDTAQTSFLLPDFEKQLDPRRLLYRLAQTIDWKGFEKIFGSLYCVEGRPALPIRCMVGLLMLKCLMNLSDEEVVEFWSESAYAQYFCGEREIRWGLPCDLSDLTHFRKRIGKDGAERILASTLDLHGEKAKEKEVVVDATVQEKNITFPTDTKLAAKIVRGGVKLANKHGVKLRQSIRAHGAETSCGTTRAPHQRRSGCSTQGGETLEDDRRTCRATTRCRLACGNKRPALAGNSRSGFESKAQGRG